MAIVRPFKGIRPNEEAASQVAALPYDVYNSREEALEVVAHGVGGAGNEVRLAVVLHERHRKAQPPQRVDDELDGDGHGEVEAGEQQHGDAYKEGDAAPDIA